MTPAPELTVAEVLERMTEDESESFSFWGDGDDNGLCITQHRYYRWGDDCVIAIGELNFPNQWDDDAFETKCAELVVALRSAATKARSEGEGK